MNFFPRKFGWWWNVLNTDRDTEIQMAVNDNEEYIISLKLYSQAAVKKTWKSSTEIYEHQHLMIRKIACILKWNNKA